MYLVSISSVLGCLANGMNSVDAFDEHGGLWTSFIR